MTHDIIHVTPCMQEKVADWNKRFSAVLGVTCQELTSDTDAITNAAALSSADIICTTPEKFGQHAWHIPFHGNLPQSCIW
jgi:replicative superfamily II helicase